MRTQTGLFFEPDPYRATLRRTCCGTYFGTYFGTYRGIYGRSHRCNRGRNHGRNRSAWCSHGACNRARVACVQELEVFLEGEEVLLHCIVRDPSDCAGQA